jgi:group I intron endonuclease
MIVYKLTNTENGKFYVGLTKATAWDRFNSHILAWRRCKKRRKAKLYWAFDKYGTECWHVEVLAECATIDEMKAKEIEYIAKLDAIKLGYNMQIGGDSGLAGMVLRKGHKRAISISRKKYWETDAGRKWKEELSKRMRGNALGKERVGYKHSEETKEKIGKGNKGLKRSEEQNIARSELTKQMWQEGVYSNRPPPSDETKRKISLSQMGKKQTEHQKKRAAEANAVDWELHFPDGHVEIVTNLRQWCLANSMDPGTLMHTAKHEGKRKSKGFWVRKLTNKKGSTKAPDSD